MIKRDWTSRYMIPRIQTVRNMYSRCLKWKSCTLLKYLDYFFLSSYACGNFGKTWGKLGAMEDGVRSL